MFDVDPSANSPLSQNIFRHNTIRLCDIGPKAIGAEYDFNKAIPGDTEFLHCTSG